MYKWNANLWAGGDFSGAKTRCLVMSPESMPALLCDRGKLSNLSESHSPHNKNGDYGNCSQDQSDNLMR